MNRDLSTSVAVIAGASSGIGRATAHAFAEQGTRLALAGRAAGPLEETAAECVALGAQAIAVPTDVRDEAAVEALAERAVEAFGSLDVWVNCAGVMAYGRFTDVPSDVFRAGLETNLFGTVHGARAALKRFEAQNEGALINLGSLWGKVGSPEVSGYVAGKFGVRGFTECLRQEYRDHPGISVSHIVPQAVDTPIFRNAGNYNGHQVRAVPPVLDPSVIAAGIVECARSPKRELTFRWLARGLVLFHAAAPRLFDRFLPPAFLSGNYTDEAAEVGPGTVVDPLGPDEHRTVEGWNRNHKRDLASAFASTVLGSRHGLRGR